MSMSKGKIILVSVASAWGFAVAGAGYFLWGSIAERADAEGQLERSNNKLGQYYAAAMFPSQRSITDIKSNEVLYVKWTEIAHDLARRGGKILPLESQTVFKQGLQTEVRRLLTLPGEDAEHPLADPAFLFGFDKYLGESAALPLPGELPMLIRQQDFISRFTETLSRAGATRLNTINRNLVPKPESSNHLEYAFSFTARPRAIIQTINALAAAPEFVVIEDFTFAEAADAIVDRLNAEDAAKADAEAKKKKEAGGRTAARGRAAKRGKKTAEAEPEENQMSDEERFEKMKADRIVTDPEMNAVYDVTLNLTVYFFGVDPAAAAEKPAVDEKSAVDEKPAAAEKPASPEAEKKAPRAASEKPAASASDDKAAKPEATARKEAK